MAFYKCNNAIPSSSSGQVVIIDGTEIKDNVTFKSRFVDTSCSTLPCEVSSGQAVVYNGNIHIFEKNSDTTMRKHYKWDGSTWIKLSDLHNLLKDGSAVVYNDEIHILGGEYASRCHYRIFNSIRKLYTIKETT